MTSIAVMMASVALTNMTFGTSPSKTLLTDITDITNTGLKRRAPQIGTASGSENEAPCSKKPRTCVGEHPNSEFMRKTNDELRNIIGEGPLEIAYSSNACIKIAEKIGKLAQQTGQQQACLEVMNTFFGSLNQREKGNDSWWKDVWEKEYLQPKFKRIIASYDECKQLEILEEKHKKIEKEIQEKHKKIEKEIQEIEKEIQKKATEFYNALSIGQTK